MLIELRIRDFAVIDEVTLEMGPGLQALSGETGAGKSIIVGALSLLMGARASGESVRAGASRANIEAVFDVTDLPSVRARMDELGVEPEEGLLILRREVQAAGRSRAWVNGSPVTAGVVGELGRSLVDLHGQHEHQTLLRPEEQLGILDAFSGTQELAGDVRQRFRALTELRANLTDLQSRQRDIESRADFLRFQRDEIEGAHLQPGEDRQLREEVKRLEHAEDLARETSEIHDALYGGEQALADRLSEMKDRLSRLVVWDQELEDAVESLTDAYERVADVGQRLANYSHRVDHNPARLDELRERLDLIFKLLRKYGPDLQDAIEAGARVGGELAELEGASLDIEALQDRISAGARELNGEAAELTASRSRAAAQLQKEAESLLPDLGLPGAVFRVAFHALDEVGPTGAERIEFLVSLNVGFEPRGLSRVASGGELSRVMLALKAILARVDAVPTLVFDEIDAGIGGVVATHVAEKLREVAGHHQVFVITHLAQLASRADRHILVEKQEAGGLAATSVDMLAGEDRVREIARMLGGDPDSEASRRHAMELLEG